MPWLNGPITPLEDAFAVSRDAGNPPVRFDVAGAEDGVMEPINGHKARNGGHSQGATCTPPRRSPTRLRQYRLRGAEPGRKESIHSRWQSGVEWQDFRTHISVRITGMAPSS